MAELGKRLGKLSLAILENFVEKTLGEKFVDELRAPTDKVLAMEAALEKSEQRFVSEFADKEFAGRMFEGLSDKSLRSIVDAIKDFYDHPAGIKIQNTLNRILSESFQDVDSKLISSAVELYINILTEEFILADEKFRENVHALADLQSMNILRKMEALLSQREVVKVETTTSAPSTSSPRRPPTSLGARS
jgi:hypothetical protein